MKNNNDDYNNLDYDIAVGMVHSTVIIYFIVCLFILIYILI